MVTTATATVVAYAQNEPCRQPPCDDGRRCKRCGKSSPAPVYLVAGHHRTARFGPDADLGRRVSLDAGLTSALWGLGGGETRSSGVNEGVATLFLEKNEDPRPTVRNDRGALTFQGIVIADDGPSMDPNVSALERAFQLADSGQVANVHDLKRQMDREGYDSYVVRGPMLEAQLRNRIRAAERRRTGPAMP
jgi:hypothetical protein